MKNRTDRLLAIILLLRSRRQLTARQLAEIFDVSMRTIYRDIESLTQAEVPIVVDPGPEGGYRLLDNYALPPVMFTMDEAVGLFLGGSFVAHRQGTPFGEAIKTALIKIEDVLPDELRDSVQTTVQSVLFDLHDRRDYSGSREQFEVILDGIRLRQRIDIRYKAAQRQQARSREISPWGIIFDNGNWYLVGYCHMREAERMFHLGRIHGAELTETAFEPPADFDIRTYANRGWSRSFYEDMKRDYPRIRIRVPLDVADSLGNHWLMRHAEREPQADGWVVLSYHDHPEGPLNFIYRFGPDFEILEPAEARNELADMATRLLQRHNSPGE
ncbi:MAG: YafY family transcriptional regulator [Gemmatimonadetes bacterium]|jgi:predicted DNA-binding transcriptional regulator YafY|nr:YafY family transcriptional regulator [Gemmatimonadota bacterium]